MGTHGCDSGSLILVNVRVDSMGGVIDGGVGNATSISLQSTSRTDQHPDKFVTSFQSSFLHGCARETAWTKMIWLKAVQKILRIELETLDGKT
ncbi:unnamed protein product [Lactuca virosa]|uniref:Uncharacterized protein n=1 Tax=Lactuca virosa TaxID=75947 RepID=A0AAU9PG52_9ASTR|nr:unnamed protein product [Lactuca virosa]